MSIKLAPDVTFSTVEVSDPKLERDGLRQMTVKSEALGHRADLTVFVSPGAEKKTNVPLVILLHGVYGSHWAWALKGGAHLTVTRLVEAGVIPPLVVTMPSDGLFGNGSGYLPHAKQDFERWIVEEVPSATALAAPSLGASSPVLIAGLSMGGFGALRLAAKYPTRFLAASGHSSATHLQQISDAVKDVPALESISADDHCIFKTMEKNRGTLPPFRFDCGTEDWLLEGNRSLHESLKGAGIPHVYEEFPGAHEWSYWELHLEDTLRFFGKILKDSAH